MSRLAETPLAIARPLHSGGDRTPILYPTRRLLATIGVTGAAFLAGTTDTSASETLNCTNPENPSYNTVACAGTRARVGKECGKMAVGRPYDLDKSDFVDGEGKWWRIRARSGDGSGCKPAGMLTSSWSAVIYTEDEPKAAVRISPTHKKITVGKFNVRENVPVKADCADPDMADKMIATRFKAVWRARKGWGGGNRTKTYLSKGKPVCPPGASSSPVAPVPLVQTGL